MKRSSGFSLVEVTVALVVGLIVAGAAMTTFLHARGAAVEGAIKSAMRRDAQLALDAIGGDLVYLGAGVPTGTAQDAALPSFGQTLLPSIRVGHARALVLLGDAPYPNAELPGIATITRIKGGADDDEIAVASEISGRCTPPSNAAPSAFRCRSAAESLIPASYASPGADDCSEAQPLARTCPWAMGKWQAAQQGTALTAVDGAGNWYERRVRAFGHPVDTYWGVQLDPTFPASTLPADAFAGGGAGFLAQLDRIFYAVEERDGSGECTPAAPGEPGDCRVVRRQCWGPLGDPSSVGFPAAGTASFVGSGAGPAPSSCDDGASPPDGTPWEVVATGVHDLRFRYLESPTTTVLAPPLDAAEAARARAVEVELTLSRRVPGTSRVLVHQATRRFFLMNRETL